MRFKYTAFLIVCAAMLAPYASYSKPDPYDYGVQDTVLISLASFPDATTAQYQFRLDLYGRFDVDTLAGMSAGFTWDNANIRMDSARATTDAITAFDYGRFLYYRNNRDSTNAARKFQFAGSKIESAGLMPLSGRRLLAKYYFTATTWTTSDSVVFDSLTFSGGSKLKVVKMNWLTYIPLFSKRLILYDVPPPTLVSPGNGDTVAFGYTFLDWSDVLGADKYRVQVDNDSSFGSPDRDVSNIAASQWTVSPRLSLGTWYWRVNATDDGTGKTGGWSAKRKLVIGGLAKLNGEDGQEIPNTFELYANYPNPFNPVTRISYDLPANSHVKITIYNALGQVVRTLVDEDKPAGRWTVEWNGTESGGRSVASGMYFYRFEGAGRTETKKMVLLK